MTRIIAAIFLGLLTMTSTARAADRYVCYVSVGGENRIAIFPLNAETGKLGPARSATLEGAPGSLGLDPRGRLLYAALRSTGRVAALRRDPGTGDLTPAKTIKAVDNPVYIVPDATGRHLLTSYYSANKVAIYPLDGDGLPGEPASQVIETGKYPHSILPAPSNQVVFVPNTGGDRIQQFRFDAQAGRLTPNEPAEVVVDKGTGPRHFRFHPSKPFVYFVNETNSSVTAFKLDEKAGTLTALQTLPTLPADFTGKNSCADIEVTPDGKYLYASNRGHDSLAGYAIDMTTGKLTSLGQTKTEKTPREFAIDPTGQFVYAAGQDSGKLASYRIDKATGKLQPLEVYDVGKGPAWVLIARLAEAKQ